MTISYDPVLLPLAELRPHPRNYRIHPPDQLAHIAASIKANGFYRNVVVARDGTILAGHGVVQACEMLGIGEVPCIQLDVEPGDARALRVLAGDNEISALGENDDALLGGLIQEIMNGTEALLGTGLDEARAHALATAAAPLEKLAEWEHLPAEDTTAAVADSATSTPTCVHKVVVRFASDEDVAAFARLIGQNIRKQSSVWFAQGVSA